jgi:hypothetical protein
MARGGHWLPPDRLHQSEATARLPTVIGSVALLGLLVLRCFAGIS